MARLWDAGVDWLTMTFSPGHKDYTRALSNLQAEMSLSATEGAPILPATHDRYIGYKQGKLMFGEREDGLIVRVSGRRARDIVKLFKEKDIDGKPTRIDFQATGKTEGTTTDYLSAMQRAVEKEVGENAGKRARNTGTYKNRGRDCGMVIGSRSSENYLRLYDKTLEQRGRVEPGLIRAECEKKGRKAREAWNMIRSSASPYYLSCGIVKGDFMTVGADFDWLATGERVEFASSYEPSNGRKKMNWFRHHVRPSFNYCVEEFGLLAVLEEFGLDISNPDVTLAQIAALVDGKSKLARGGNDGRRTPDSQGVQVVRRTHSKTAVLKRVPRNGGSSPAGRVVDSVCNSPG